MSQGIHLSSKYLFILTYNLTMTLKLVIESFKWPSRISPISICQVKGHVETDFCLFNDQNTHQPYVHESFLLVLLSDQYHDIIKSDSKLVRYVVVNKTWFVANEIVGTMDNW